jgi:hypothetical protein
MSCALTEYRRPKPRYCTADAGWHPSTGWELVEGRWQRWWRRRGWMASQAHGLRRALVWRAEGLWAWNVCERGARCDWRETQRGAKGAPHFAAQQAMPFAELAAVTR